MKEASQTFDRSLPVSLAQRVDEVCSRFEEVWTSGQRPCIEDYLGTMPEPERSTVVRELIALEVYYRRQRGETLQAADYQERFPDLDSAWLARVLTRP